MVIVSSTPGQRLRVSHWHLRSVAGLAAVVPLSVLLWAAPGYGHTAAAVTRAAPADGGALVVPTDKGKIQGKSAEGIDQFLGIPYAAPPVGALRWAAPEPVTPGPASAARQSYGNRCPQLASGNGPRSDTEDCLYLNVFTPPARGRAGRRPGRGLPVLVMIHGGGLVNGSRRPARRLADREHRPHRGGVDQLPARRVRVPGRPRPRHLARSPRTATTGCSTTRPRCDGCSATSAPSAGTPAGSPSPVSRRAAGRCAR